MSPIFIHPLGDSAHGGILHQARVPRCPAGHVPVALAAEGKRLTDNLVATPDPAPSSVLPRSVQARGDAQLLLCVTLLLRSSTCGTQQRETLCMQKSR